MDRDATCMTRVQRAALEPGTNRRIGAPKCGSRDDPGTRSCTWKACAGRKLGGPLHAVHPLRLARAQNGVHGRRHRSLGLRVHKVAVEFSADVRLEVLREGSRPPGRCGAAPAVATRDSGYRGSGPGSRLACCCCCCCCCCDARVRPQQRGCGVLSIPLRIVQ